MKVQIMRKEMFKIDFLDHVAIRVRDMEASVNWYERVLGLKTYRLKEWDPFPIFLMAGQTGIALFPAHLDDASIPMKSLNVKIDHFAFRVDNDNFKKAQKHLQAEGIVFELKDHTYYHSLYMTDPDGHTVELTTLVVDESDFF